MGYRFLLRASKPLTNRIAAAIPVYMSGRDMIDVADGSEPADMKSSLKES